MRLQTTHNLSQGCVTWQEMQKGYHQSRLKRTMTNEKVCQVRKQMAWGKSTNEYELGLYLDLYSFYLPRYGKICDFMLG